MSTSTDKHKVLLKASLEGNIISINNELLRLLCYKKKEILGKHYTTVFSKFDIKLSPIFKDYTLKEQNIKGKINLNHKFEYLQLPIIYKFLISKREKVFVIKGTFKIINDIKETFKEFISHINSHKALFNYNPDGILIAEAATGKFRYANRTITRMLGYTKDEFQEMSVKDIHPKNYLEKFKRRTSEKAIIDNNIPCLKKNKELLYVDIKAVSLIIEDVIYRFGFFRDNTEQKQEEQEKQEKQEKQENTLRLNQVVANTKDWLWEVDVNGLYTYSNDSIEDILGFKREEIIGIKHFFDLFDSKSKQKSKKETFIFFNEKLSFRNFETINISKNGRKVYLSTSGTPILDDNGNLKGYRGLGSDITILKNSEIVLEQHRKNLIKLVKQKTVKLEKEHYHLVKAQEISHVGTWEIDLIANSIEWTKETYRIFCIPENTIITYKGFLECIHPDDRAFVDNKWQEALSGAVYDIEHRIIADGQVKWIKENAEIISNKQRKIKALGTVIDITKQKKDEENRLLIEKQLSFTQKMQAIGSLTNGMGHEFNNIIGIIMGMAEILQSSKKFNSNEKKQLEEIYNQGERAVEIINNMQTFTSADSSTFEPIQLDELIKDISKLLKIMLPCNIKITYKLAKECPIIIGNVTNIQQIIFNICNNSVQAMQGKEGKIEIELKKYHGDTKQSLGLAIVPGECLRLCITDTGQGVKHEILEQIFNPFFSTKDVGKGIGLGLSVVHGIVKAHKGAIKIDSVPNKGTRFYVYFPISKSKRPNQTRKTLRSLKGTENILIVEDEEALSKTYKISLEKLGYNITIAHNGEEALEIFKTSPNKFDIIFTDYIMPKMDGLKLGKEIYKVKKGVPILLATGYNTMVGNVNIQDYNIYKRLAKPVKIAEITHLIRDFIDKKKEYLT